MGRILLYFLGGYVALVLLSSALYTGPGGLPLLALVVIAFVLYRAGVLDKLRKNTKRDTPILSAARSATLPQADDRAESLRYTRRFESGESRLRTAFPEDPLESDALVALLAAVVHEAPDERERVESAYRAERKRFLAWQRHVQLLGPPPRADEVGHSDWLREARALAAELDRLEAYVADVETRAEETEDLPAKAIEHATRARELVASARAASGSVADPGFLRSVSERLDAADEKSGQAWAALEKGKERPLSALRLAQEAVALAEGLEHELARTAGLPDELATRLSELEASIAEIDGDLERVHEEFEAAAESYAPSSWHEIGGVGHAARRAVDRARRLHESATRLARSTSVDQLERAKHEADDARLAVDDAARLRDAIEGHLAKLERAAVEGRERVVQAERELDRAWSDLKQVGGGDETVLVRASELVQQAREALATSQPYWLTIVELADRAAALARDIRPEVPGRDTVSASRRGRLERARARAKEARDSAWARAIVRPAVAEVAPALLEATEQSYQAALEAERSAADEAGFAAAEELFAETESTAAAFCRRVDDVEEGRAGQSDPAESNPAHAVVWDLRLTGRSGIAGGA